MQIVQRVISAPSYNAAVEIVFEVLCGLLVRILLANDVARKRFLEDFVYSREYEPRVTAYVRSQRGAIFVDCGASLGHYSFLAARNFRVVYAIEPEPGSVRLMKEKIMRDAITNIRVVEVAVGEFDGETTLGRVVYPLTARIIGWSIEQSLDYAPYEPFRRQRLFTTPTLRIPVRRLSSVVPDEVIDVVKLDVEGAEWRVLRSAESLMGRVKQWIIEIHDITRRGELASLMEKHGYSCDWLDISHALFKKNLASSA